MSTPTLSSVRAYHLNLEHLLVGTMATGLCCRFITALRDIVNALLDSQLGLGCKHSA